MPLTYSRNMNRPRKGVSSYVLFKFDGAEMSSDADLMLLRRIEQQLGLSGIFASCLSDPRALSKTRRSLEEIIRFRSTMIAD